MTHSMRRIEVQEEMSGTSSSTSRRPLQSSMASLVELPPPTRQELAAEEKRRDENFVQNLKDRRHSSPLPDLPEVGLCALIRSQPEGRVPADFPGYWLVDRLWVGGPGRATRDIVMDARVEKCWPLQERNDLWELLINQPSIGASDQTRHYTLSKKCAAEVKCHHG